MPSVGETVDRLRHGTDITGNEYNSMQQRHTKFYRLDIEYIKSFGDGD